MKLPEFSQDWDAAVSAMMVKKEGLYFCTECSFSSSKKPNTVSHIQAKHLPGFEGYKCSLCGNICGTLRGFDTHLNRLHGTRLAKHFNLLENFTSQEPYSQ